MAAESLFKDFQQRFKLFVSKRPDIVENTRSNIFTMRLIGNKTHGDMAEIGIAEFIHQFMYDFDSRHVGKDLFRAKYGAAVTDRKTKGRLHPMYMFLDGEGRYICEVRCGGTAANALQRGFWTHTINAATTSTASPTGGFPMSITSRSSNFSVWHSTARRTDTRVLMHSFRQTSTT